MIVVMVLLKKKVKGKQGLVNDKLLDIIYCKNIIKKDTVRNDAYRITSSKKTVIILSKSGNWISYHDVRGLILHWTNLRSTKNKIFGGIFKCHQSLDINNNNNNNNNSKCLW